MPVTDHTENPTSEEVKGAKRLGVPVGNWLTAEQGKRLLLTADSASLRGKRDYATLAILLGCGLRRAELTALRVEDIQQRKKHWVIADLVGKGGRLLCRCLGCSLLRSPALFDCLGDQFPPLRRDVPLLLRGLPGSRYNCLPIELTSYDKSCDFGRHCGPGSRKGQRSADLP